eukprot:57178-Chlamydomonas_euryale.AAC.3
MARQPCTGLKGSMSAWHHAALRRQHTCSICRSFLSIASNKSTRSESSAFGTQSRLSVPTQEQVVWCATCRAPSTEAHPLRNHRQVQSHHLAVCCPLSLLRAATTAPASPPPASPPTSLVPSVRC